MNSVPIIVVFTKYEDFRENVKLDLEDKGMKATEDAVYAECEKKFKEEYCKGVSESLAVIRVEGENQIIVATV